MTVTDANAKGTTMKKAGKVSKKDAAAVAVVVEAHKAGKSWNVWGILTDRFPDATSDQKVRWSLLGMSKAGK